MLSNRVDLSQESHVVTISGIDRMVRSLNQRGFLVIKASEYGKKYCVITAVYHGQLTLPNESQDKIINYLREKYLQNKI